MLHSLTSIFFRAQEDVTIEGDVSGSYECSLYNLPKFRSGQCINHYMRVFAIQNASFFHPRCSSREERPFFDLRVAMAYLHTLNRFQ